MRHVFCIVVALSLAMSGAIAGPVIVPRNEKAANLQECDLAQSAALFVGVRDFKYDKTLTPVRFAVDDAVDLAHALAIEARPPLVPPARVVLALSGDPEKPASRKRLEALLAAGAIVREAGQSDVLTLLDDQAGIAGYKGLLIVAFATHGVSEGGTQYLLTATSIMKHVRTTSISEAGIRDAISHTHAPRSLILLDACREKLTTDTRDGVPDPRSAAALLRAMAKVSGQVIFSAAAPGEYAYDDAILQNGVFTAAVIEGLRCRATADSRGLITVDALVTYVDDRVLTWIQEHRDRDARRATQLISEGRSRTLPLVTCGKGRE